MSGGAMSMTILEWDCGDAEIRMGVQIQIQHC